MSDNKLKNRIKNENIQCKLEVAPMEDKIRETRLRWFGHVQKKPVDATVRKIDWFEVTGTSRDRKIPKKIWIEIVRNDIKTLYLTDNTLDMTEWKSKIHVPILVNRDWRW